MISETFPWFGGAPRTLHMQCWAGHVPCSTPRHEQTSSSHYVIVLFTLTQSFQLSTSCISFTKCFFECICHIAESLINAFCVYTLAKLFSVSMPSSSSCFLCISRIYCCSLPLQLPLQLTKFSVTETL